MGADRRDVGRARHQHADGRVLRPAAALRPALFREDIRQAPQVCWLPDCFGFSPALPQILRLAGIDSFFTIKVNWSETNQIAVRSLLVGGLDGSRVLAHTFNNPVGGYNGEIGPRGHGPRPGGISAASTSTRKACSPSAMATAAAARRRR